MKASRFVDAQGMARRYPRTFEAPSRADLRAIRPGDYVKVAMNRERFWTKVVRVDGDRLEGAVANDLVMNPQKFGQKIRFNVRNVYVIQSAAEARRNAARMLRWSGVRKARRRL